jgi:hypothetical protein
MRRFAVAVVQRSGEFTAVQRLCAGEGERGVARVWCGGCGVERCKEGRGCV